MDRQSAQLLAQVRKLENTVAELKAESARQSSWVRGNGSSDRFFILLEDMPPGDGEWAWAELVDWTRTILEPAVKLYNWGDFLSPTAVIDNAPVGYGGICRRIFGRWAFVQSSECLVPCVGEGAFDFGLTPPAGTIGQDDYSFTPGTTGTIPATGAFSAIGLPTDWAIDPDTGEITGPNTGAGGIAGPAGEVVIVIKVTTPNTDTGVGGNCDSTRRLVIPINAA